MININKMIGNTPMIKINYEKDSKIDSIYVKIEYYNLTGSIKDRMAHYIIKKALENKILKQGMPIIEATSGNTGISLAALGALYKHPVKIFMPDWVSSERINIMKMYGAEVFLVSKKEGGFKKAIELADMKAKEINGFRPNQFSNIDNIEAHYLTTGKEIIEQIPNVDSFVSGIGTGGTLMGVAKRLKEQNPKIKIYALEPDSLPLITSGNNQGSHKIEGIGDDFIPSIVDIKMIDEIILVNDNDAINMAKKLSTELGLGVGISSGANLIAAIKIKQNNNQNIVTIFPDDNKKYLTTDLAKEINNNSSFISNQIKLIDYEFIN